MKKQPTIEQILLASRPEDSGGNAAFIGRTMEAIERTSGRQTFAQALNNEVRKRPSLLTRLRHLPTFAVVVLAFVGMALLSGTAYAAYKWIEGRVTVTNITPNNDDNRREYTLDESCGDSDFVHRPPKYEVARGATLTDEEAYKVFKNSCDYVAMSDFIADNWVSDNTAEDAKRKQTGDTMTLYESSNMFAGNEKSNFGLSFGKVTAISPTSVTIAQPLYVIDRMETREYIAGGRVVSRTMPVLPGAQAWYNGALLPLDGLAVGDTVRLVRKTVHPLDDNKNLKAPTADGAIAIIKTDIDGAYLWNEPTGNPAIVKVLAGLYDCHNNKPYVCVGMADQMMANIYTFDGDDAARPGPYKRTDMKPGSGIFRTIQGRITAIDGKHVTLTARGKADTIKVELPYDAITEFNKDRSGTKQSQRYAIKDATSGPRAAVGDMAYIQYEQKDGEDRLDIKPGDLVHFSLLQYMDANGMVLNY
jgi:hypothetical protein